MSDTLTLPVNAEYFHQIKDRSKPEEFRLDNDFWNKRITGKEFKKVCITLGYPKKDDVDKRVVREWKGYVKKEITHKHFDNKPEMVFAIDMTGDDVDV